MGAFDDFAIVEPAAEEPAEESAFGAFEVVEPAKKNKRGPTGKRDPNAKGVGPGQSISDSLLETVASVTGLPGTIIDSFINVGFAARGMERDQEIVPDLEISVGGLIENFIDAQAHSGATMEERTEEGRIAKVATDVAGLAVPVTAGTRAVSQSIKYGDDIARNITGAEGQMAGNQAFKGRMASEAIAEDAAATVAAGKQIPLTPKIGGRQLTVSSGNFSKEKAAQVIDDIVTTSASSDRAAVVEVASGLGAAQGAGIAEAADPGDDTTRMVAETVGAIINPGGTALQLVGGVYDNLKVFTRSMTEAGRQKAAGEYLTELIINSGDGTPASIQRLITKLREVDVEGVEFTSGQKTGDETLLAMEKYLANTSASKTNHTPLSVTSEKMYEDGMNTILDTITALGRSGDPDLVAAAAVMREKFLRESVDAVVANADEQVKRATKALDLEGKTQRDASVATREILDNAIEKADAVEKTLWLKVPQTRFVKHEPIQSAVDSAKKKYLVEGVTLPAEAERVITGVLTGKTQVGDLQKARSVLLNHANEQAATGHAQKEAALRQIAEGMLDSMSDLPGYETARAYTSRLHDFTSRSDVGKLVARDKAGAEKIPADLALQKVVGQGDNQGGLTADLKTNKINEFGDFVDAESGTTGTRAALESEQSDFLRMAAQRLVEEDGSVKPGRLKAFTKKNQSMLDRPEFKQLKTDLADADSAALRLKEVQARGEATIADFKQTAVAKLVGTERPVEAISGLLKGKNPSSDIEEIIKMTKTPAEKEGLASAMLEAASKGYSGDFASMRSHLTGAEYGGRSVLEIISDGNLLGEDGIKKMRMLMDRAAEVEKNKATGAALTDIDPNVNGIFDLAVRIAGAKIGSAGAAGASGASIVAAGAGSRFLRQALEKAPWTNMQKVLVEAAENPKFMAALLEKGGSVKIRNLREKTVRQGLIAAGIAEADEDTRRPK